jgi:hypothetical protein
MDKKPSIFCAIPAFEQKVNHKLIEVIIHWLQKLKCGIQIHFIAGYRPLVSARNTAVTDFLKTDCTHLLFIDDDIVPPSHALEELLEADKDVVCPVCLMVKDIKGMLFPMPAIFKKNGTGNYKPYYGEGIEEVDTITGGCFLIKRHVLEDTGYRFKFEYNDDGIRTKSADVVFSETMKKHGYKLYAHYDIVCHHVRTVDLCGIHKAINGVAKRAKEVFSGTDN